MSDLNPETILSNGIVKNMVIIADKHSLMTIFPKGGKFNSILVDPRQASVYLSHPMDYSIDCVQTGNIAATNGNKLEFQIKDKKYGRIESARIKIQLNETGGAAAATPTIVTHLFDRIETRIGSDSFTSQVQYDDNLLRSICLLSSERLTTLTAFTNMNMNTSFASPTSMALSTSSIFELPLSGNILECINMDHINMDTKALLTCWIATSTIIESGAGVLQFDATNTKLLLHTRVFIRDYHEKALLDLEKGVIMANYYSVFKFENTYTFTQATDQEILFNNVFGLCTHAWFWIRSSVSNASGGRRLPTNIGGTNEVGGNIQLKNKQGLNTFSQNGITPKQLRTSLHALNFVDANGGVLAIYDIQMGNQPSETLNNGNINGCYFLDGQQKLVITPATTAQGFTTGSYVFTCYFYMLNHLFFSRNGKLIESTKAQEGN